MDFFRPIKVDSLSRSLFSSLPTVYVFFYHLYFYFPGVTLDLMGSAVRKTCVTNTAWVMLHALSHKGSTTNQSEIARKLIDMTVYIKKDNYLKTLKKCYQWFPCLALNIIWLSLNSQNSQIAKIPSLRVLWKIDYVK